MKNKWNSLSKIQKRMAIHAALSIVTSGAWLIIIPFVEIYFYVKSSKVKEGSKAELKKIKLNLDGRRYALGVLESSTNQLCETIDESGDFSELSKIAFADAILKESREGASTTSTQGNFTARTKTGTVGLSLGNRLSIAASQGDTKGQMNSHAITQRGKDRLTQIDAGKVVITGGTVSFIGSLFTRSSDFKSIVNSEVAGRDVHVSSTNYEKAWVVAFETEIESQIVGHFLEILKKNSIKKMKSDNMKKEFLQLSERLREEVVSEISNLESQLSMLSIENL